MDIGEDFLIPEFRQRCETIVPDPQTISCDQFVQTYLDIRYALVDDNNG